MTKEKLKNTLLELLAINCPYPDEYEVLAYCRERLRGKGDFVEFQEDSFGNIIARIPGEGEPVLFSTHVDIPEPAPRVNPIIEGDIIRSDGTSILGVDPKSGLAVLIELLCYLAQHPSKHSPLEVLLTRGEEKGLFGARNADYSLLKSKIGLVLDEDGPVTNLVVRAPGYVRIDASFVGKIVHPREPENGINALQVASQAINSIPWGYSCEGVTWNIGMFNAGTARNSVPGHASLNAELRSFDTEKLHKEADRIETAFCETAQQYGARCDIEKELEFEGYELERMHPLFKRLEATYRKMDLTPKYYETFGGSDANIFNAHGIMGVPIGSAYYNAHQYTEYVNIAEMEEIFNFLNNFLRT